MRDKALPLLELDVRVPLRRLEIFCVVVEEGGVTRAAERLLLAQPAVTGQVRALERWLDTELLQRRGNRFELTEAGHRFHAYALETLTRSREMLRDVEAILDGDAGEVIVTASPAVGTYVVPSALFEVLRDHPRAQLASRMQEPGRAMQSLAHGECDLAIVSLDGVSPPGLAVDHVHREPLVLVAAGDDCDVPAELDLEHIGPLTVVGAPPEIIAQRRLERRLRSRSTELRTVMSLAHPEAIKAAVVENGWVAFLPLFAAEADLASRRLRRIEVIDLDVADEIVLLHRDDKTLSPLQEATLTSLRQSLARREARRARVPDPVLS